ncbi:MAG: hypothetical protein SFV23_01490 [Planctomycetaceae bacterium]|nr:hypothetical protein [Planctomycetaceae bacterium]
MGDERRLIDCRPVHLLKYNHPQRKSKRGNAFPVESLRSGHPPDRLLTEILWTSMFVAVDGGEAAR